MEDSNIISRPQEFSIAQLCNVAVLKKDNSNKGTIVSSSCVVAALYRFGFEYRWLLTPLESS